MAGLPEPPDPEQHSHRPGGPGHRGRRHGRGRFGPGFGPGFPPHGPSPFGGRRGRRTNRGDVRTAVLALVAEQPRHGYEIIQEIAERSAGAWRPSPGSVYPTLQ
ncbi:MAG: PadR family transcriptional regulator, partial [Gemmatimonadales bacterium]